MSTRVLQYVRSNVLGLAAIFIALSGSAYAGLLDRNSIHSSQIAKNAVGSSELKTSSVGTPELKKQTVLAKHLASDEFGGVIPIPGICRPGEISLPVERRWAGSPFPWYEFKCFPTPVELSDSSGGLQPCPPDAVVNFHCIPTGESYSETATASGPDGIPECSNNARDDDVCLNPEVPVAAGKTVRGVIGWNLPNPDKASLYTAYASLPFAAAAPLDAAHVLVAGQPGGSTCTGTPSGPEAPRGFVCVYLSNLTGVESVTGAVPVSTPYGFSIQIVTENPDGPLYNAAAEGTWAYRAP